MDIRKTAAALFADDLRVINIGLEDFAHNLRSRDVPTVHVDWRPPAGGDARLAEMIARLGDRHREANLQAIERLLQGRPTLIDIGVASEVIPRMRKRLVLHAGPPVTWDRMCGPMRGAVLGGLIYEGLADTLQEAETLAASGGIDFEPCHHHDTVGPMAGVVTASMPVWIVENSTFGNRAYCTFNEGLGKVLRYGANSAEVVARLKWIEQTMAPIVKRALAQREPIDLKTMIAQALQMGDEGHNRNRAGTSLFIREIAPELTRLEGNREEIASVLRFMHENDHFFLNLSMPACKCITDASRREEGSSLIVAMARNGTDFGIQVSGLGDRWFTAPATMVEGLYLPGFSADDAAPDIGDSVITETAGIGGCAMAAAPAIVKFVGGSPADALAVTKKMYDITMTENDAWQIPLLDFRGSPTGLDLVEIIETGTLPAINTGIAHREPGVGMVGAGLVVPPKACFIAAFTAFVERYGGKQ